MISPALAAIGGGRRRGERSCSREEYEKSLALTQIGVDTELGLSAIHDGFPQHRDFSEAVNRATLGSRRRFAPAI